MCKSLRSSGVTVPAGYEAAFQRALWTYRHQRVYCADARTLVPLRPLPAGGLAASAQVICRARQLTISPCMDRPGSCQCRCLAYQGELGLD